ncbi:hypothetical protein BAE44_0016582 [Dichanthelium oligosanthes]|uniref:Uncharacterized protein n=1 Tax=Dichanthelium oligosanthes TaxID=888268 RepID=A0A1E5VB75_9POAL|nr:hypothetical protein BAE44_0016582 [Dichanthelium oligosanthes]
MCAAVHGHRDLVEILFPKTRPIPSVPDWSVDGIIRSMKYLRFKAQPNKVVNHVFLPLMMACCGHSLKSMKLLVQAGADVNFIRHPGSSILMKAVGDNLTDIVKFLLEAGADPNIGDEGCIVLNLNCSYVKQFW